MTTPRADAAPKRLLSGFCNPTLPRTKAYDPHTRCRGCDCPCHTQETTVPIQINPDVQQAAAARILTPRVDGVTTGEHHPDEVVLALRQMADQLNAALVGYEPDDWRDAVRLLHRLRVALTVLRRSESALVQWLYLHGEHGLHQVVDGVPGQVSITRGRAKERWESEGAVKAYVETQLRETGEVPEPLQVVAWVLEVLPATQSTSLRKTPLREAGIDLEDYYWSEPGSLQVSTPKT